MFIENVGQWPEDARFQVWGSSSVPRTTWLAKDAIWISVIEDTAKTTGGERRIDAFSSSPHPDIPSVATRGVNVKITFPGSNPNVKLEPFDPLKTSVSYFIGNDPARWHSAVPAYGGVRYADLYPGIDLVIGQNGDLWKLEAKPTAKAVRVKLQVEGAEIVAGNGAELKLLADDKEISVPLLSTGDRLTVQVVTQEQDHVELTIKMPSLLDRLHEPVNSPGDLVFGTFVGGSNTDYGYALAIDDAGNTYMSGLTLSSDFPVTPGAFDPIYNADTFVFKLGSAGNTLEYATFLGGTGAETGYGIAVDQLGYAVVTGGDSRQ